jgi:hypothetical protein
MFQLEKVIKNQGFCVVEIGKYEGQKVVKKKYFPEHSQRFYSEISNLKLIEKMAFKDSVNFIDYNPSDYSIIFPYIEGVDGYEFLNTTKNKENALQDMLSMVNNEINSINKDHNHYSFVPEGLKLKNVPFCYSNLMLQKKLLKKSKKKELKKLFKIKKEIVWGRYDPELSNLIINDNKVKIIDYESLSLQDNCYFIAYIITHLKNKNKHFNEANFLTHLKKNAPFNSYEKIEDKINLNFAEVLSYLILETPFNNKSQEYIGQLIERLEDKL